MTFFLKKNETYATLYPAVINISLLAGILSNTTINKAKKVKDTVWYRSSKIMYVYCTAENTSEF